MNKSPQYYQQTEPKQYKSKVEEMYSPKTGNWSSQNLDISENTGCHARENSSEETISENSQIWELHETIKLLHEEVSSAMLQQKNLYLSLDP